MTIREQTSSSSRWLGPGEVASLLGTTVKALRVYEKAGLLTAERRDGGWRVYGPEQVDRLRLILALKALGLPLKDIRAAIDHDGDAVARALDEHAARLAALIHTAKSRLRRVQAARHHLAASGHVPAAVLIDLGRDLGEQPVMGKDEVRGLIESAADDAASRAAVSAILAQQGAGAFAEAEIMAVLDEAMVAAATDDPASPSAAALADRLMRIAEAGGVREAVSGHAAAMRAIWDRVSADPILGEALTFLRAAVVRQRSLAQKG
jgi:DNA-binding transcriptional MerR regulator